ncbi:MAG TPA: UDP-2,4-diacetamido-2,4,6-trideoxy-beta-L-altropyranose hydrolase [Terriglobales bacterium]|nr:UDP-2,4-diacetamido-2,4,6-trideoxy-beta-L-altropyranose hydrolase [Terriglobales bacterium]
MKRGILLIRADGSLAIGTGHVMRCLALAQAWRDAGGDAVFAMADATPAVEERLRNEGFEVARAAVRVGSVADAEETAQLAHKHGASWVVVDGYEFGAQYQTRLKSRGLKVLFIDDNGHAGHYSADLVLNQNAHAREDFYPRRDASTRLLLGPRFAMLRREFTSWRGWNREIPAVARRVLVTMGGSDPDNITGRVVRAILAEPSLNATVVVGGSNPHLPQLRELVAGAEKNVQLVENVPNMPELMAKTDVAISGAGTTSLEMCFLGLPALLIVLADNQRPAAEELNRRGAAINLGEGAEIQPSSLSPRLARLVSSQARRRAMSERGKELVDGHGAERVVRALRTSGLQIRRATMADCELLWELANDPTARASAFSQATIPWEDHVAWFESKMQTPQCHILVGEAQGAAAGQVRVDERPDGQGEIDVSVAREFRGAGVGSRLIDLAVRKIFASTGMSRIHAYILPQNTASQRAFENAGFQRSGEEQVKGHGAWHFVRDKATGEL